MFKQLSDLELTDGFNRLVSILRGVVPSHCPALYPNKLMPKLSRFCESGGQNQVVQDLLDNSSIFPTIVEMFEIVEGMDLEVVRELFAPRISSFCRVGIVSDLTQGSVTDNSMERVGESAADGAFIFFHNELVDVNLAGADNVASSYKNCGLIFSTPYELSHAVIAYPDTFINGGSYEIGFPSISKGTDLLVLKNTDGVLTFEWGEESKNRTYALTHI